jgi:hypothetical protein
VVIWQARVRTAHGGGLPLEQTFAFLFLFEGGRVRRAKQYLNRTEALEAAGLSEEAKSEEKAGASVWGRGSSRNRVAPPVL